MKLEFYSLYCFPDDSLTPWLNEVLLELWKEQCFVRELNGLRGRAAVEEGC